MLEYAFALSIEFFIAICLVIIAGKELKIIGKPTKYYNYRHLSTGQNACKRVTYNY